MPADPAPIQLIRSCWQPNDLHSATRLSALVASGHCLRVRRGVYVAASDWIRSPPWVRAEIAIAAMATRLPESLFCRESALLLHGLPLARTPPHVTLRTTDPGLVGISRREPMTGTTRAQSWLASYHSRHPEDGATATALLNLPTRRIEPVLPHGMTRSSLRQTQRGGASTPHQVRVPAAALTRVTGPAGGYRLEPVELAVPDTVSRMPFAEAVVVLDALLAQHAHGAGGIESEPAGWGEEFLSRRLAARYKAALTFADAESESPGESVSRALIHELGFAPPALQVIITTELGEQRVDFEWVLASRAGAAPRHIVGEFDGRGKYFDAALLDGRSPGQVHYAEKLREDALRRTGRGMVRWGWAELNQPEALTKRLLQAGVPRGAPRARPEAPLFLGG
ncbi:hypothetical protein [Nesterenkonia lutea]|uniref:Transcriptional regulator, AbiEi antitoxin, Type IV TA system n=1 Tax=Nesterenkonia lutea TaxID=272919 RepID=A0ABR9JCW6_9MICC|nr:hypothetical protein [Nesterenkonia lutea]MBE1523778.1 hypothetical protein [Nesterenkonia lutea]